MACDALIFDVTPEQWDAIKRAVSSQGVAISSDYGEAEKDGIRIRWTFYGQRLEVQCVKKPWIIPASVVNDRIRQMFQNLGK
jgi:hypothetical protein